MPQTLFEKIWNTHVVHEQEGNTILYIDRQLVHEVTSAQAFAGLRENSRPVRCVQATFAVPEHNVPTHDQDKPIEDPVSAKQVETLRINCKEFGIKIFDLGELEHGIVHVMGPEQGLTLPGTTIVCGDSHTSTHGAFGALAFGIGTSEVEHVLATQTLQQNKPKTMRIVFEGNASKNVTPKDLILATIGQIGTAGGTGFVIEYTGEVIRNMSMEGRMTLCNMTIEAGARAGLVAPDEKTFEYVKGRTYAPKGQNYENAVQAWKSLNTDEGASFDAEVIVEVPSLVPQVTWGTSPGMVTGIDGQVPDPAKIADPAEAASVQRALDYMGLTANTPIVDIKIDRVFIGSCTNSRIEDLRAAAQWVQGKKVHADVSAMVVPGSGIVKKQAESEGLHNIFMKAGFDWRQPGCSMCLAMNDDILQSGERCASTSNRNFEGRQGKGGRTHLVSPVMAAAAAIAGHFVDLSAPE